MPKPTIIGTKVRAKIEIDRSPDFMVPAGSTGTIAAINKFGEIEVKFDQPIKGAEEWNNTCNWVQDHYPGANLIETFWSEMERVH